MIKYSQQQGDALLEYGEEPGRAAPSAQAGEGKEKIYEN